MTPTLFCRMEEAADAFGDSDEEADYSKMDQGNKKGPVGRWDFDTQEEYIQRLYGKQGGSTKVSVELTRAIKKAQWGDGTLIPKRSIVLIWQTRRLYQSKYKMDQGNKKALWGDRTLIPKRSSDYMANKEALPK